MTTAQNVAACIRRELLRQVRQWKGYRCAVALSGGIDSNTILFAMLSVGIEPTVVSYTPDTHESTDHRMARATAEKAGLRFISAIASTEPDDIDKAVRRVILRGWRTKLEVECLTPMLSVMETANRAGTDVVFTGDQADGYYINNNWMSRNYDRARGIPGHLRRHVKDDIDPTRIDDLRRIYYTEDRSCSHQVQEIATENYISAVVPYRSKTIYRAFRGTHWREVNMPRLKEPSWLAFDSYVDDGFQVRDAPVNLHRGDSQWSDIVGSVMMNRYPGPWRTVTGLYSAIYRGNV